MNRIPKASLLALASVVLILAWPNGSPSAATAVDHTPAASRAGSWSQVGISDLQVVTVSRTPRYPRYDPHYSYYTITEPSGFGPYVFSAATGLGSGQTAATQRWPNLGDLVTYTATIRNRGTAIWNKAVPFTWRVDGGIIGESSASMALEPESTATVTLVRCWDGGDHEIGITLDIADARPSNNQLAVDTRSVGFLSYVDRSFYQSFAQETANYPNATTDDFIDWLNLHMARFNAMLAAAGTAKRVHFEILQIIPDGSPDPTVERINFAIFPFRYLAGQLSYRHSGYYSAAEDIDYGLLHEMGHQLGLIDLYRLDVPPERNQITGTGYNAPPCLMHGVSHFISPHSAAAMNHWLATAHGYFGQYLYGLPREVRMRFRDASDSPLAGATVTVYQKVERPGLGEIITNQVKAQGVTDSNGELVLPNVAIDSSLAPRTFAGDKLPDNPFGYVAVVGTNGLLLLKVERNGFADHAWLDITELNQAYWAGATEAVTIERRLALGGSLELAPPPDLAELNAASWVGWAQDGDITLSDDPSFYRAGSGSVRVDATGGFDNYVRYPGDHLARWDLSQVQFLRFWGFATNPNPPGFQNASPHIRLGNADGYFEWRPSSDVLNNARGIWQEFVVPIAGDALWARSQSGTPSLAAIHYLQIHADTWGSGFTLWVDGARFEPQPTVGVSTGRLPLGLWLAPFAPNPASVKGSVRLRLPVDARIELAVYDLRGRRVRALADRSMPAGEHAIVWDLRDGTGRLLPAGVYFIRLRTGGEVRSVRAVVLTID